MGAIEPQFYAQLLRGLGIDDEPGFPSQFERDRWPYMHQRFTEVFSRRTRDEWAEVFDERGPNKDACVTPVLDVVEAQMHRHNIARSTFSYPGISLYYTLPIVGINPLFLYILHVTDSEESLRLLAAGASSGLQEPNPAPHLSRTPGHTPRPLPEAGEHTREVLESVGFEPSEVSKLITGGGAATARSKRLSKL